MSTRSFQQKSRRFLSTALRNDARDTSETLPSRPSVYEIAVTGELSGPAEPDVVALQFIVFRSQKPNVFRLPLRRDRAAADFAEAITFAAESHDELVVEAIVVGADGKDRCLAYGTLPLAHVKGNMELQLRRGAAAIQFISQACSPDRGEVLLLVPVTARPLTRESMMSHPTDLSYPPFTCIPRCEFYPRDAVKRFKVIAKSLELLLPRTGGEPDGKYETRMLLHNGYSEFSVNEKPAVLKPKGSAASPVHQWEPSETASFPEVPLLASTHLIVLLYRLSSGNARGGARVKTAVGVAAIPLVGPDTADQNLELRNVPILQGPYSSTSPERCLPVPEGSWFKPHEMTLNIVLEYYDTPRAAPRRVVDQPPQREAPAKPQPGKKKGVRPDPGPTATTQPGDSAAVPAPEEPEQPGPAVVDPQSDPEPQPQQPTRQIASHSSTTIVERLEVPPELEAVNKDLYRMLRELNDEVQAIRRGIETPGAVNARDVQDMAALESERLAEEAGVEVVDLALRRVALPPATRSKMMAGARHFSHPTTNALLSPDHTIASTPFDATAIAVRFDGVTLGSIAEKIQANTQLRVHVSFGFAAESVVGPALLAHCGTDTGLGQTYGFAKTEGSSGVRGLVWSESVSGVSRGELAVLNAFKQGRGSLYVQLFDEESRFYVGSASIPAKSFERPPHARHYQLGIDVPLQWDTTTAASFAGIGAGKVGNDANPLVSDIGLLHVTTCAIGIETPHVAPKHADVNAGATRRIVEVKRLPGSTFATDVAIAGASEEKPPAADSPDANAPALRNLPAEQRNLHALRAMHVKKHLDRGGLGATSSSSKPQSPTTATGGADRLEMDLRMKVVERKREELKATRIAEHLRSRITRQIDVTVARGIPETLRVPFVNPYPSTMNFTMRLPHADTANPQRASLQVLSTFGKAFSLAPREECAIPFVAGQDAASQGTAEPLLAEVFNDRGEVVLIISVIVTMAPPVISRRHAVYGDPGSVETRTLFMRSFGSSALGVERGNIDDILNATARVASWPKTAHSAVRAVTNVSVDPFAGGYAASWETVNLEARIPTDESRSDTALVHFYATDTCERHLETWELFLGHCRTLTSEPLCIGQTTRRVLPIACDRCYVFNGSASAAITRKADGTVTTTVDVKPVVDGKQSLLLHAFVGDELRRYALWFNAVYPEPTRHVALKVSMEDASVPLYRRLPIHNTTSEVQSFSLSTTYRDHAELSHTSVEGLQSGEHKYVTLKLKHLSPGSRYPVFVFVNDKYDKTVESFLVDVTVDASSSVAPIIAPTQES